MKNDNLYVIVPFCHNFLEEFSRILTIYVFEVDCIVIS